MIKIPLNTLIDLFRLASLGKQVGGLIHNINGPLQNIGLDIEMANFNLKSSSGPDEKFMESLGTRLNRMGNEFERVNQIIKSCSTKVEHTDEKETSLINFNNYVERELSFLDTNLYYKHNVQTQLKLKDNPPMAANLPEYSLTALSWFLQLFIEELERIKIEDITLESRFDASHLKLIISTNGKCLSEKFIGQINQEVSSPEEIEAEEEKLGLLLVLIIFMKGGITLNGITEDSGSIISIVFPVQ